MPEPSGSDGQFRYPLPRQNHPKVLPDASDRFVFEVCNDVSLPTFNEYPGQLLFMGKPIDHRRQFSVLRTLRMLCALQTHICSALPTPHRLG